MDWYWKIRSCSCRQKKLLRGLCIVPFSLIFTRIYTGNSWCLGYITCVYARVTGCALAFHSRLPCERVEFNPIPEHWSSMFPTAIVLLMNQPRSQEGPPPLIYPGSKILGTKLQLGFDWGFTTDLKERLDRATCCLLAPKFEARLFLSSPCWWDHITRHSFGFVVWRLGFYNTQTLSRKSLLLS